MTYTPATIAKAITGGAVAIIGAATVSAGGPDLSVLDFGQWLGALGTGLVAAAGVFATPNKNHQPEPDPVSPADQVIAALPAVVEHAAQAAAELDRVKQAATDALGTVPVIGPLAKQAIDSVLSSATANGRVAGLGGSR